MSRTIIIGGGQAGAAAANALRLHGYDGEILLIGRERHLPYERPALSKSYLKGDSNFEKLIYLSDHQIESQKITFKPDTICTKIDRTESMVFLSTGDSLSYDFLILATGGSARTAPGLVPDDKRIFALRTCDDALGLQAALDQAGSILVIGGGWLGLELAATARALGKTATVIEAAPRLCARAAPPDLSAWLTELHTENGVSLAVGRKLAHLAVADGVMATLDDGTALSADLAVIAIGLTPHTDLAADAGLPVDDGILTDSEGRTEDARIFAIGDCARYPHPFYGQSLRLESWQNANLLADRAARAICGMAQPAFDPPWFWSDQHGRNIQILGRTPDGATAIQRGGGWIYLEDGRLVGLIAIDAPREIAQARKLVADGVQLDPVQAADASKPLRSAIIP